MAARGARAATSHASDWIFGRQHTFKLGNMDYGFCAGIARAGWVEGRTVKIEYRWAEGQSQRYAEIAD